MTFFLTSESGTAVQSLHDNVQSMSTIETTDTERNVSDLVSDAPDAHVVKTPKHSTSREHVSTKTHPMVLESSKDMTVPERKKVRKTMEPKSHVKVTSTSGADTIKQSPKDKSDLQEKALCSSTPSDVVEIENVALSGKVSHSKPLGTYERAQHSESANTDLQIEKIQTADATSSYSKPKQRSESATRNFKL